mgnify:CR=1 FL=1
MNVCRDVLVVWVLMTTLKVCESFDNYILIVILSNLRLLKVFPSPYQQTTGKADKQVRFSKFTPENSSQELIRLTPLE